MPATRATTVQQRQEMARLADQGESYQVVADQIGVSFWSAATAAFDDAGRGAIVVDTALEPVQGGGNPDTVLLCH